MKNYSVMLLLLLAIGCGKEKNDNNPPTAIISISPPNGTMETTFLMDGSESFDLEDSLSQLQFRWDFESDKTWDTEWTYEPTKRKRYTDPGVYQVSLEVKDTEGLVALSVTFVEVNEFILIDLRDMEEYKTVKIGKQIWMAENLNYESQSGSWCHSDSEDNCRTYGRLYDWHTAQFVCPAGWKLPSAEDWDVLVNEIGSNPADHLRADFGWNAGHNGLNDSGFTALPASFRSSVGSFSKIGSFTYFWETDEFDDTKGWSRLMFYNRSDVERNYQDKNNAFSVRCLKY